ncbi:NACHT domain-containing protein [Cyanobacteria bacterium FACHB-472]|nr:NACHT domain-containing protein [Cyanobacteria bacterium FACHB-472]
MAEIRNRNSVQVNEAGKQKLIEAKAATRIHGDYQDSIWTYWDIAKAAGVSEKTVKRFFAGQSVDCDNAIAIASSLNLELAELIDPKESNPPDATPENPIGWGDICHKMLEEQLRRYQFRRQATGTGLGHEVAIYVPLGLVKPTTQPRRSEKSCPSPDEGSSQYQLSEKEIEKRFEADAFLRQVIEAGEGKTIAIIGEPGAGKSTWLEQIARHLKDSENVSRLPICIQLGSLDGKTLEDYLLQVWLKEALSLQGMVLSAQMQTELMQLFNSHQVWLLLDGVDEIRGNTSTGANSPLQGIANQLRGWVAQAQTLLTCRLNVWQANDRVVPNCDVYRTLDFDDPQVGEFIGEWFARAEKPQLGKQLREKLGESGRERIRDLIRNPLRLALLCQTWAVKQGELPKTKATLYQRFREDFYEWKKNEFPIGWQQRQELNAALGRLAVAAIENQTPLRESLAYQVMGESLFELARQIGWLNLVYRDGETDEPVYAFFHLTFQEYFAALAIDNWHFFLTHDNDNPQPLPGNVYRIFEPQWKEVILLWLGREDVEREHKEEFIQALVEFDDGCKFLLYGYQCTGFYEFRALFIAATGIAEFRDSARADEIVAQFVEWAFGYLNPEEQLRINFFALIERYARYTLLETDRSKTIAALVDLCRPNLDEDTRLQASIQLMKINKNNSSAIATLIDLSRNTQCPYILNKAVKELIDICRLNQDITPHLIDIFRCNTTDKSTQFDILNALKKLEEAGIVNINIIASLKDKFEIPDNYTIYGDFLEISDVIKGEESVDAIFTWINLYRNAPEESTRRGAINRLKTLTDINKMKILGTALKDDLSVQTYENDLERFNNCYEVIWYYAQEMYYLKFYQAWHYSPLTPHPEVAETTRFSFTPNSQNLNLAKLPSLLRAAIDNDPHLKEKVQPICIDASKFENPDNPASEIYAEMVMQGCPERQNGEPETMQALKVYCQLKCQEVFLIFYEDTSGEPPQSFSQTFLTSLSKFHNARRICVLSDQPCNLQTFSPSQPNLVADIVSWIREKMMEE